jgi:hypothetical protein
MEWQMMINHASFLRSKEMGRKMKISMKMMQVCAIGGL